MMEGNLGEAPSRRFPGISPNWWTNAAECVVVFGGWDFLPHLFEAGFGFLSSCLCFLDFSISGGGGGGAVGVWWGISPLPLPLSLAVGV